MMWNAFVGLFASEKQNYTRKEVQEANSQEVEEAYVDVEKDGGATTHTLPIRMGGNKKETFVLESEICGFEDEEKDVSAVESESESESE